jgi:filamentous hemagglutinin family protein
MMYISIILKLFFISQCLMQTNNAYEAFGEQDEAPYLEAFSTLIKDSYSASLPQDLTAACKNQNQATVSGVKSITSSMLSSDLQTFCGADTICTIPAGFTVTMNSNLNVAALVVSGSLVWNDVSQPSSDQWLCAGYIAVRYLLYNLT